MSRLLQYSFPGRPGGLAPDSIEEWGSGDSTDDLARRADESDLSQGGKRRGHRHRRSSQAPRPHPPVFVYTREAERLSGAAPSELVIGLESGLERLPKKTLTLLMRTMDDLAAPLPLRETDGGSRRRRRHTARAEAPQDNSGLQRALVPLTLGPSAAAACLGPASGWGVYTVAPQSEAPSPLAVSCTGSAVLQAVRQYRRDHTASGQQSLQLLRLLSSQTGLERLHRVAPADRTAVRLLAALHPLAPGVPQLQDIVRMLRPEEGISLGQMLGWPQLADCARPAGLRYRLDLARPAERRVMLRLFRVAAAMRGAEHLEECVWDGRPLDKAALKALWYRAVAVLRALPGRGQDPLDSGVVEFTFSCLAVELGSAAATRIQAAWRGHFVRQHLKRGAQGLGAVIQEVSARQRMLAASHELAVDDGEW